MRRDPISTEPLSEPDPVASARFAGVLLVVAGVLATLHGLGQAARWEMEGCASLVETEYSCRSGDGVGALLVGVSLFDVGLVVVGLLLMRGRRAG